jgi:hypothetical protein
MKVVQLIAAAALFAAPANAQPPPQGWVGALAKPSILCDTSAQLQSIVDAFERSVEAGTARFAELFRIKNQRREPTCAVVASPIVMNVGSSELGRLSFAGAELYGWILHVKNDGGEGYYLYLETPGEALQDTI